MLKDSSHDLIYNGIKSAYSGNVVVNPKIANKILEGINKKEFNENKFLLQEREVKIIEEIAKGYSNKEIAEKLYLSEGTIKNNITNILSKLQLRDRTQIAIFAFKNGIVT